MSDPNLVSVSPAVREAFASVMRVVRKDLASQMDVCAVRPGYKYPPAAPPQSALVVAVAPGMQPVTGADIGKKYAIFGRRHRCDCRGANGEAVDRSARVLRGAGGPGASLRLRRLQAMKPSSSRRNVRIMCRDMRNRPRTSAFSRRPLEP